MPSPVFTPEDKAFLRAILHAPDDVTTWLVYADWLEERADPRADYLRFQVELGRVSADDPERPRLEHQVSLALAELDPTWVAILDRPPIENCPDPFAFRCPKKWEQLTPTPDETVRFCESCAREVVYCQSLADAQQTAAEGYCVAISRVVLRTPGDFNADDLPDSDILGELEEGIDDLDDPRDEIHDDM